MNETSEIEYIINNTIELSIILDKQFNDFLDWLFVENQIQKQVNPHFDEDITNVMKKNTFL